MRYSSPKTIVQQCKLPLVLKDTSYIEQKIEKMHGQCIGHGYAAAGIDSFVMANDTLFVFLYTGTRHYWGNVAYEGQHGLLGNISFRKGQPANVLDINRAKKKLVEALENHGYPFASVGFKDASGHKDTIAGHFETLPGEFIVFDSLKNEGSLHISKKYLQRYLELRPGQPYNEKLYVQANNKLGLLPFASAAGPTQVLFNRDKARVYTFLNKESVNRFNGIVGFGPNPDNEAKTLVTGNLELWLINVLGRGESFNLYWKRLQVQSQKLDLMADVPFILGYGVGLSTRFSLLKQDSTFLTLNWRTATNWYIGGLNHVNISYRAVQSSSLNPGDSISNFKKNNPGAGFYYSTLARPINPVQGLTIHANVEAGFKTYTIEGNESSTRKLKGLEAQLELTGFVPLYNKMTLKTRGQAGYLRYSRLFLNELLRVGGLNSLRGFEEESIYAKAYSILTLEPRYIINEKSHVMIFYDAAVLNSSLTAMRQIQWLQGLGAGLQLFSRGGLINLALAYGKVQGVPLEMNKPNVHIGYVAVF
ncbi:MAG: BamA/TamA family outer membrane protein [Bacteroidales bacterium]|nr:BamA/TamA family outer membrane protein [Bacteroidales bacterium]